MLIKCKVYFLTLWLEGIKEETMKRIHNILKKIQLFTETA